MVEHSIASIELGDDPYDRTRAIRRQVTAEKRSYGHTKAGEPITDGVIKRLVDEADRGYEPGQLNGRRRGPGRPPLGESAKSVESVRLEPALRDHAARRAEEEGITVSELIRRALRQYLNSA